MKKLHDFEPSKLTDHEFANWLRKQDQSWTYRSFDRPPGTYYIAKNKIVAVVFYDIQTNNRRIFILKK